MQHHQVGRDLVADMQINDPIHQIEASERDGEEDARVFVDVRRGDAEHLLQVLLARQLLQLLLSMFG